MLIYFAVVAVAGALLAPVLFWAAQSLAAHGVAVFLAKFDFESFFHRALLIAAALLLWPFLRWTGLRSLKDLGLLPNHRRWADLGFGFVFAIVPLLCCGVVLIMARIYLLRSGVAWAGFGRVIAASAAVPLIEEAFFRGLILGLLLRRGNQQMSILLTSIIFSVVHFLKAPEKTTQIVTWTSGFRSIHHAFTQFNEPVLVLAMFTTLFLVGWVLADARVCTRSLWLPIGLHAGWIFGSGVFSILARRQVQLLPWLGKNLLVGIIPLGLVATTWIMMRWYVRNESNSNT